MGDVRESPALKIIMLLRELGADVVYHDPYVASLEAFGMRSEPLDQALSGADLVLLVTAHRGIDYEAIAAGAACLLDLRGVVDARGNPQVVRL